MIYESYKVNMELTMNTVLLFLLFEWNGNEDMINDGCATEMRLFLFELLFYPYCCIGVQTWDAC